MSERIDDALTRISQEQAGRESSDDLIRDDVAAQGRELETKANIFVRQAQGITVGNNIQGMHIRISNPAAYTTDWSFLTGDGQSFVRTDNSFVYYDGQGGEVVFLEDGEVLIDDWAIADPFLISAVTGSYSNPEFFYRYFDIKDLDQRIGYVSALRTDDKSSVVNGINSLKGYVDAIVESAEVADSPFASYADFLAGSGGGVQQGKYAYVTFTGADGWPTGGKWDMIAAGDTWRLDCGVAVWSPTTNMTAATTATLADQSATGTLKQPGNDTVTNWLQSFRNNLKRLLGLIKTDGDGSKVLFDNGVYGSVNLSSKRTARVIIGTTGRGYTAYDVDFLCNGTNDSAQFAAAYNAVDAYGEIKILDGTYILTKPWILGGNNRKITGAGEGSTILRMTGTRTVGSLTQTTNPVLYVTGQNYLIEGLTLDYGDTPTEGYGCGIYFASYRNTVRNCTFNNKIIGATTNYGVYSVNTYNTVTNCTFTNDLLTGEGSSIGIYFTSTNNHSRISNNRVANTSTGSVYGIEIINGNDNIISDNEIQVSGYSIAYGIYVTGTNHVITGNRIYASGSGPNGTAVGIYGVNCKSCVFTDNVIDLISANSYVYALFLQGVMNSTFSAIVLSTKTAAFKGFFLRSSGTGNTYDQIIGCNLRGWASYCTGNFTINGSDAATFPGSPTSIVAFTAIGAGSIAGFNMM